MASRIILFRGWDTIEKVMVPPELIIGNQPCYYTSTGDLNFSRLMLMEYSGKNDIAGKHIFEGDIVTCRFRGTGVVVFKGSCFQLITPGNWQYVGRLIEPTVIGNVYETPELIPSEMKDGVDSFIENWQNGNA